jgi:antitoxin MazE
MYILPGGVMANGTIEKVSKVARWGNSLGFRIPQEGVERLGLKDGESVKVRVVGDTITIRRAKARKKWTEKELLKGVTPSICGPDLIPNRRGRELL